MEFMFKSLTFIYLSLFQACWVVHCFAEVKFQNDTNLKVALDLTRNAMCNDKELPVRVEAAIALQLLLTEQEKVI